MSHNGEVNVSVVIVNFNTKDITLECIKSLLKHTANIGFEIITVDNGSTDGFVEAVKKLNSGKTVIRVIANKDNLGFAAANNQGLKEAKGEYVLFLNSDTLVKDNVLGSVFDWMEVNQEVGAAGVKIVGKDGKVQEAGGYFPTLLRVFSWMTIQDLPLVDSFIKPFHPLKKKSFLANTEFFNRQQHLDWIIGAFVFARKAVIDEIGGWDASYFMYTEDTDLCFRIKQAGYKIAYLPTWQITHLGGASSVSVEFPLINEYKGVKTFYKKHYPAWQMPFLRLILKIGALGRMLVLGILEGRQTAQIYAKAFTTA